MVHKNQTSVIYACAMEYPKYCFTASMIGMMVLLFREQHAQILSGPTNQEVLSGEVAMFNCTLACGNHYPVTWYVTLPATMKTVLITPNTQLNQIKSIYGMEVSRGSTNECRSQSGGYRVEQIYVKALKQFHLMPVQCSTVCIAIGGDCGCGAAQLYFSKVALLSVADVYLPMPTSTSTEVVKAAVAANSSNSEDKTSRANVMTPVQRPTVTVASTPGLPQVRVY